MAYRPPRQSGAGQIADSLLILALLFLCLLLPFELKKKQAAEQAAAPPAAEQPAPAEPTWESLGQGTVQAQQWEKLGKKPADAKGLIETKFDFAKDLGSHWLWITAIVIVGYFLLLLRISDREYREVIAERFGKE
ncbi:MAG: hypothetical protein EXR36_01440 [Betaproteobacteria bacterium]|nr:hypothetical protein [Betaproteobacteria bacterium]